MITVKEKYYELKKQTDKYFEGFRDPIHDYVIELEQELSKLKESQTQKSIIKLCNRVDKAEVDKAELMKFVKEMNDLGKLSPMQLSDYTDIIYHGSLALLNKHTDKPDALQNKTHMSAL